MAKPARSSEYGPVPVAETSPPPARAARATRAARAATRLPPASYFGVSAVFHYLGPSLAVLLFARVSVLGVAWLRIASERPPGPALTGIAQLAAAMLLAMIAATPFGLAGALPAFTHPAWLLWGAGVGLCSSVIPYVTDQLAMARLPRATFALMLALLPVFATVIGAVVLRQLPTAQDVAGITLVVLGVALHKEQREE